MRRIMRDCLPASVDMRGGVEMTVSNPRLDHRSNTTARRCDPRTSPQRANRSTRHRRVRKRYSQPNRKLGAQHHRRLRRCRGDAFHGYTLPSLYSRPPSRQAWQTRFVRNQQ